MISCYTGIKQKKRFENSIWLRWLQKLSTFKVHFVGKNHSLYLHIPVSFTYIQAYGNNAKRFFNGRDDTQGLVPSSGHHSCCWVIQGHHLKQKLKTLNHWPNNWLTLTSLQPHCWSGRCFYFNFFFHFFLSNRFRLHPSTLKLHLPWKQPAAVAYTSDSRMLHLLHDQPSAWI